MSSNLKEQLPRAAGNFEGFFQTLGESAVISDIVQLCSGGSRLNLLVGLQVIF